MKKRKYTGCQASGCEKYASFGPFNQKVYCGEHKESNHVNISKKKCQAEDCIKNASYGRIGSKKALFCQNHATEDHENVRTKQCAIDGCKKGAMYNTAGSERKFCKEHKKTHHENIFTQKFTRKCATFGCTKHPSWKDPLGEQYHCVEHRTENEHRINFRKCADLECSKRASLAPLGQLPLRCATHQSPGDVNTYRKNCMNCNQTASFGIRGEKPKWCRTHCHTSAINLLKPTCSECENRANYGYPSQGMKTCMEHRDIGMIYQPNKQCSLSNCRERAEYGVFKHDHCELHKVEGEINLVARICSICGLMGALNRNDQCETCRPELFVRKMLYKQNIVVDFLKKRNVFPSSIDRILDLGECGMQRPDLFFANDDQPHTLIVEVDENQHKSYDCGRTCTCGGKSCNCDVARMKNIQQSQGGRPGYFLRFNPDDYKCKHKPRTDIQRLIILDEWIQYLLNNPPTAFLQVLYLFYDGHNDDKIEIETLVPWDAYM